MLDAREKKDEDMGVVVVVELDEEAVSTRGSITREDPPNAHQTQHCPKTQFDESVASVHTYPTKALLR